MNLGLGVAITSVRPLDPYAAYALAMDFDNASYNVSGTNYPLITSVPGYTFTRSGAVGFTNTAGGIDNFAAGVPAINDRGYHAYGALTNLLLNAGSSSVLATQSVTVTAAAHTISFIGTGSVALSGAFVGSLAGTSATNQVALTFTPTAAALTVTVTGDVRFAGLMAAALSGAVPIIATGATTASIGASELSQAVSVPDEDYFIWAAANSGGPTSGTFEIFATFVAATSDNLIYVGRDGSGNSRVIVNLAAVNNALGPVVPMNTAGRKIIGVRRRAGKFTQIVKTGGVTTVGTETALIANPAGLATLRVGMFNPNGFPTLAPVEGVFRRVGTFTDTDMISIVETA